MGQHRRNWIFWVLLTALVAALPIAYFLILDEPPRVAEPPPQVSPPAYATLSELRISELEGTVEIRTGEGPWVPAASNAVLKASDSVRTGEDGHAVLSAQDAYDVRLEAGTDVSVESLTASISKLMLGKGMATARVRGAGKHAFEVHAAGTDVLARTSQGTFAITHNGEGTVALGTQEGEVEFVGKGKAVIVRAGQQSVARQGASPSEPISVPNSLLTKIQWPSDDTVRSRKLKIQGTTAPGTWLRVGGRVVHVDAQGRFTQQVELREGSNDVSVRAQSVGGIVHEEKHRVRVDTTPPPVGIDQNLWKQ
jgi:hypothetical protein